MPPSDKNQQVIGNTPAPNLKSVSIRELRERIKTAPGDIVKSMVPERGVVLFAGDSGIGKSPWLIQKGICVAAGVPFLGYETRAGRVLCVDFENHDTGLESTATRIAKDGLGLEDVPENFRFLQDVSQQDVFNEIKVWKPLYITIDSLRGMGEGIEGKNDQCAAFLKKIRDIARTQNCTFEILHHLKKPDDKTEMKDIETTRTVEWMLQVSGPRALINQTDVRIAVDMCRRKSLTAEIVVRWHYKLTGEYQPIYIGRKRLDSLGGEPVGYERQTGIQVIQLKEFRQVYETLPDQFHHADMEKLLKNPKTVQEFIGACRSAGILNKIGERPNTHYVKVGK